MHIAPRDKRRIERRVIGVAATRDLLVRNRKHARLTVTVDFLSAQALYYLFRSLHIFRSRTPVVASVSSKFMTFADDAAHDIGRIFNEILKGEKSRESFYQEILDVLCVLGGERPC